MAKKPQNLPKFTGSKSLSSGNYVKSLFSEAGPAATPTPPPPDFAEILAKDPYYQAALANLNAAGVYDKGSRDQAIKQAMIRFGYAPEAVAGMTFPEPVLGQPGHQQPRTLADILDPTTRSLAQQNTTAGLSIWARLADAAKQQQLRTTQVLGARGLFRSGETGYQLKRGILASDQAKYDATNKLMDFLTGAQAAYVQAEMQRQALLLQAQRQAAEDAANNPPATPPPPGTGTGGGTGHGGSGGGTHPAGPGTYPDVTQPPPPGPAPPPPYPTPGWKPPKPPPPDLYDNVPFGWGQGGTGGNFKPQ